MTIWIKVAEYEETFYAMNVFNIFANVDGLKGVYSS